jgi:hypothetical protein
LKSILTKIVKKMLKYILLKVGVLNFQRCKENGIEICGEYLEYILYGMNDIVYIFL